MFLSDLILALLCNLTNFSVHHRNSYSEKTHVVHQNSWISMKPEVLCAKKSPFQTVWSPGRNMDLDIINQVYKKPYKEGTSGLVFHHDNRSSGDVLQWGLVCFWYIMKKWDLMLICAKGRRCIWPMSVSSVNPINMSHFSLFQTMFGSWSDVLVWNRCSGFVPCNTRKEFNNIPFMQISSSPITNDVTIFSKNDSKVKRLSQFFTFF